MLFCSNCDFIGFQSRKKSTLCTTCSWSRKMNHILISSSGFWNVSLLRDILVFPHKFYPRAEPKQFWNQFLTPIAYQCHMIVLWQCCWSCYHLHHFTNHQLKFINYNQPNELCTMLFNVCYLSKNVVGKKNSIPALISFPLKCLALRSSKEFSYLLT